MNITLDQARCFCALIEAGGYQAAARQLHKSHSAIVYAVQGLEEQTDLQLLNRSGYRTVPTKSGDRVYQQCKELLSSALDLEKLCSHLKEGWEPSVKMVYDGVLPPKPFLNIFTHFKTEKIPTLLEIYSDYLQGVEKAFLELDAQFMISVLTPKQQNLHAIELKPLELLLVAHRDHALFQQKKEWTTHELKQFNFFTVRGADKSLNLGTKELEETSTFHLSDFSLKKSAILEGAGFGWLPKFSIQTEIKRGLLKPVRWEFSSRQELHPKLYYRKRAQLGRASEIILRMLS